MTSDRWRQVREVMESVLELEPVEREGFLSDTCAGDRELRSEVESLLRAHEDAGAFLGQPAVDLGHAEAKTVKARLATPSDAGEAEIPPPLEGPEAAVESLGGFRILEEIGYGGMGTVYLATPAGAEEERVAVKVAQRGLPRHARRRFRNEHRILADLDHPYIARALAAGTTGDARPYFVMEYVRGTPIDEYCTEHGLSVPARLELFLEVCAAVETAHRQGVVHRDIKPSNILVSADGEPKLLDFGIAKLLDPEAQPFTVDATGTSERLLTPQYASPEQLRGDEVTPQTDVYSLGVLLYKLLAGRLPYVLKSYSLRAMERAFEEQEPSPPSEAVVEGGEPPRGCQDVGGDLDAIVMKALSVEAGERYVTVADLARDLQRHLEGQPSRARLAVDRRQLTRTLAGRLSARRRRFALSLALVLLVVSVASLGTYFLGFRDAELAADFSFAEGDRIVLGELRNLTGESLLDDSLETALRIGLEQSRYLRVLSRLQTRAAAIQMQRNPDQPIDREAGIKICLQEGGKVLVLSRIEKIDLRYEISFELVEPRSGATLSTGAVSAAGHDDLLRALFGVTVAVRTRLGESPDAIAGNLTLERITSHDLRALRAYSLGMERFEEHGAVEEAAQLLRRAISLDPEFAMAHARLGMLYHNLKNPKATVHFARALELADRLTPFEELYVKGWLATREKTLAEMIDAWESLLERYPDSYVGHYNLGMAYRYFAYDYEKAARAFETAARQASSDWSDQTRHRLAECYLAQGDSVRFDATIQDFSRQSGKQWQLRALTLRAMSNERDREARTLYDESKLLDYRDNLSWEFEIIHHADKGSLRESLLSAQRLPHLYRSSLSTQILVAILSSCAGEAMEGSQVIAPLVENVTSQVAAMPRGTNFFPVPDLAVLGKTLARHGAVEEAETILRLIHPLVEINGLPLWRSYTRILEGEILFARGRPSAGVTRFREALAAQESFQAHESLARAYEIQGDVAAAIAESEWLATHRGRALVEGEGAALWAVNVIEWSYALFRLGRLHDRLGREEEAIAYYQRFVGRWRDGDRPPVWHEAEARLEGLLAAAKPSRQDHPRSRPQ